MIRRFRARGAAAALVSISTGLICNSADGQDISTTVEVSTQRTFVPLQSYVVGEVDGALLFFCGLSNMGLHSFGESAFPSKKFSTMVYMVDRLTGDVSSASISHLSPAKRRALTSRLSGRDRQPPQGIRSIRITRV